MTLNDSLKLKPPTFSGKPLMEDPQLFLDNMVKAVRALQCSSTQVVELVAYRLEDHAEQWYEGFIQRRAADLPSLTWKEFSKAFMEKYLPPSKQKSLAQEFEKLEQMVDMTIAEYEDMFAYLSRYASHMVATEALKASRFIWGLVEPMFINLSS